MNMFIKIKIFTLLIILFISTNLFSSSDDSLLKEAKELEDEFLADLAEIVNIDSPADYVEGINSIQEILSDMLEELGAEVKVMESPIGANQLTAVFSGGGKKSIY